MRRAFPPYAHEDAVGRNSAEAEQELLPSVYVTKVAVLQTVLLYRSGPASVALIPLDPARQPPRRRPAAARIAASRQNAAKKARAANHATSLSRPMMFSTRVKL